MARSRILKPGFFTNEVLAELPFEGRLLFAGLWTLADKEGRLEDRQRRIKVALFPWDDVDVERLLDGLAGKGFILRYEAEGSAVIQIVKFADHQAPHVRESKSILPCREKAVSGLSLGHAQPQPRTPVSVSVSDPVSVSVDSPELTRSVTVLVFPVVGKGSGQWPLSEAQVAEWAVLYPNLDVPAEMRKALAWIQANPGRRKTAGGMSRYLVNWLSRATDRGGGAGNIHLNIGGIIARPEPRTEPNWTFECPHQPHCRREFDCVQKQRAS